MCNLKKQKTKNLSSSDIEKKLVVARGEEVGINMGEIKRGKKDSNLTEPWVGLCGNTRHN